MNSLRLWLRDLVPVAWRKALIGKINRASGNRISRLLYGPVTYNQDGLATTHNADFMTDPRFAAAYAAGQSTGSWTFGDLHWRAYVICWAAARCAELPGDFVECGVNRGGFALAVVRYVDFAALEKRFFLLDTYEGLVDSRITAEEKALGIRSGEYEPCYEAALRTFADFDNVVVIKGPVPDTLPLVDAERVSFLSLDMNTREPEIAAANHFWDRLVPGGMMVLDDYGWRKHLEQKRAFDQFAQERGTEVLALPTGQGLILKR